MVALLGLVGLLVATQGVANAQCSSARCTDLPAVENIRAVIAAACDCSGARSHRKYVRCAKKILKSAVREATLPPPCKKPVLRCEARSTCGSKANICCVVNRKGRVKALQVKGQRCGGNLCENKMALADACTSDGACTKRRGIRSFKSVQRVFQTSCALPSCHSTFAREGELVLDSEDVSYKNLVNRGAEHPDATDRIRVVPGDPANSYLVQKLRGTGPGDPMPDSGVPLAEPIITMVEEWITRGAKSTAEECAAPTPGAESLCDDEAEVPGDYQWQPLPALEAPPATDGIQMVLPPEDVATGTEWEKCYAVRPNWTEVAQQIGLTSGLPVIRHQTYRMHPGSHHLLLYAYMGKYPEQWPTGYFPCVAANCTNASDCPADADGIDDPNNPDDDDTALVIPIGGTQVAGTRYEVGYPNGVGIPVLTPDTVLIVNPHYTNPFVPAQPIYGEAWLNLYFYKQGEFKVVLDGIFAINFADLFVEPYETRTISRVWVPRGLLTGGNTDAAVFQLFGHMHKRATEFQIDYVRGGACSGNDRPCGRDSDCPGTQTCIRIPGAEDTTIYYTTSWDLAPIVDFPEPYFHVDRDEGLRWTCTHVNGVQGDPTRPPKKCEPGCTTCGWDDATRKCTFTRGVQLGIDSAPRIYDEGDPMPLVFGQLADDDMCNMFGYFINQADLPKIE